MGFACLFGNYSYSSESNDFLKASLGSKILKGFAINGYFEQMEGTVLHSYHEFQPLVTEYRS